MRTREQKTYHVVPEGDGWAVTTEGSAASGAHFDSRSEAIQRGHEVAFSRGHSQLVVHDRHGAVQQEHRFSDHPFLPADPPL